MNIVRYAFSLCLVTNIFFITYGTQLVPGNGTAPLSVTQPITAQTFDKTTGIFYIGLASGGGEFALSRAARAINDNIPTLSSIASNTLLNNQPIEFLTLTSPNTTNNRFLAIVTQAQATSFAQTNVILSNTTGTQVTQSSSLNDASGAPGVNGQTTTGIVALTASDSFVFTAVRPAGIGSPQINDNFGQLDSGIAVLKRRPLNNTLVQTAAQSGTGDFGIKAQRLDPTSPTVRITADPTIEDNQAQLQWDTSLERLYTGLQVTTGPGPTNGAKAVVVGRVNSVGALTFSNIAPDGAFSTAVDTNMIGALGSNKSVNIYELGVLHASTGPDYLIINGGNATLGNEGHNAIFALPLVNNPSNAAAHGTLANKDAPLVNFSFVTPATTNADLPQSTEPAVAVGAGPLPCQHSTPITSMVVSGDTVYISLGGVQTNNDDTGIFYSQALFDQTGKIIRWTPWTKSAFPADAFANNIDTSAVQFFAIDATDGRIWAVDAGPRQTVLITSWERGNPFSLISHLNTLLPAGSFSYLDLDQSTRGFSGATTQRYALFGGNNAVVFALTSTAFTPTISSPQMVTADYTLAQNSLVTQLPPRAGQVQVLEYTRQETGSTNNYFFAGTNTGLFAFTAPNGTGFDVATLTDLDQPPFTTGVWQKITALPGAVIDVKTTGNRLYVVTYHLTKGSPEYRLYSFSCEPTIDATINSRKLIAQSRIAPFTNASFFNRIGIIATQPDGSQEQIVVTTNQGLYKSSRPGGVQDATTQADANWQIITAPPQQRWFTGLGYIDNAALPNSAPSILWPFSLIDPRNCGFFNQGTIDQLLGSTNAGPFTFIPSPFASNNITPLMFNPISYFWSDGLRRLFITVSKGRNQLFFLPYDTRSWGLTGLTEQSVTGATSPASYYFNWAGLIGATGIFAVGTDNGVIALE